MESDSEYRRKLRKIQMDRDAKDARQLEQFKQIAPNIEHVTPSFPEPGTSSSNKSQNQSREENIKAFFNFLKVSSSMSAETTMSDADFKRSLIERIVVLEKQMDELKKEMMILKSQTKSN